MGMFYGFKPHLIVNERGDLLAGQLTPGNIDDRQPLDFISKDLFGKLFGDKGYISQELFEHLTNIRKNTVIASPVHASSCK